MFNDYLSSEMNRMHREELIREAQIVRLIHVSHTKHPTLRDRLLSRSGEFIIQFGQKLKTRYEPRIALQPSCPEGVPCERVGERGFPRILANEHD